MRQILALPTLLFTIPTMKQLSALRALSIFLPFPSFAKKPAEKPVEEKKAA